MSARTRNLFPVAPPDYSKLAFPELRECQRIAHMKIKAHATKGHKRHVLMLPTGAGKTIMALYLIWQCLLRGKRCMFICDRTNLIGQTSKVADGIGLHHGIIQASNPRMDMEQPFQIASAQTLMRRGIPDGFDLVIVDECHTQYKAISDYVSKHNGFVVGLSATPFSPGLGKLYTNLVAATTADELTRAGILVPMRVFCCTKINMQGAKTVGGEWSDGAAAERGMEIIGDVVVEWAKHASDRKTIIFGASIEHCEEMARQFNAAGFRAEVFCATTTDDERKAILGGFEKPDSETRILISVEALAKGFDAPDVSCVCDCRPLRKSLSTFIQMIGRGLRSSLTTGKEDCLLLDFSGNIIRFADDYSDIFFNGLDALDTGEKLDKTVRKDDEKEPAKCPKCGYSPMGKVCVGCGYERPAKQSTVEVHAGEMQEITLGDKKLANDAYHLFEQCCTHTRSVGDPDTAPQRAYHLFREMTKGQKPPKYHLFSDIPDVPITRNVANKIHSLRIAYAKNRQGGAYAGN